MSKLHFDVFARVLLIVAGDLILICSVLRFSEPNKEKPGSKGQADDSSTKRKLA